MVSEFEEDVTRRVPAGKRGMSIPSFELVVVSGPDTGARVQLRGGAAKIGTAEGVELRLRDPTVSRLHCELRVTGDHLSVRDLGSTNGTIIGGLSVRDAGVPAGTVLAVGSSAVRIEAGDEPALVPLSNEQSFGALVGGSLEMRRIYAVLERVAPTDTTVLLSGETGTGKDVAARSIHSASRRASGPFVPVDCASVPETLFESELFGHVRGAFSGATGDRTGVFEEARGGTLFLDEIGELPLGLQAKLLRALESRAIRPIGSNTERPIDVRVIAATNRSLARSVNEGTFREDLYYRLAVVEVAMPPLRARKEDIPELAEALLERITGEPTPLPPDLAAKLSGRAWPGNVRELRNYLERTASLGLLTPAKTAPAASTSSEDPAVPLHLPLKEARERWIEEFETTYVRSMLASTGGNVTRAAERAGVSRRFLQRTLARLGIRAASETSED